MSNFDRCRLFFNVNKDATVFDLDRKGANGREGGEVLGLPGPDVEPSAMPWTLNDVPILVAFRQRRFGMAA